MSATLQAPPPARTNQRATTFSPEAGVLVNCARVELSEEHAENIRALAAGELDWESLLSLAVRHG
ncbi:MAG: hypothetical protein LC800_08515, partial [Acidobacteria bacterium]|nr:hypothetical protein [Acidobacteriota bacterium]